MISPNNQQQFTNKPVFFIMIFLISSILFGVLFYANYQFTRNSPGGTDFLYRWLPTRLILFEGYQNPYSPEVEYQVELVHHGHAHQGNETPGIFAYPFYIIPIYIPFASIENYPLARSIWMTMLEIIQMLLVILTLRLFKIKMGVFTVFFLLIFSLCFSFFTQPIIDGNPSPIAALFVLISLIMIRNQKDWLAGFFLAFSTIKPQMVLLFFILVWIWSFSHRRWKIILGSVYTLLILLGGSFAIQPTWFTEFLKDVLLYPKIASPHSPVTILDHMIPNAAVWVSLGITGFVIFILAREWIRVYKADFRSLFWVACLTFLLSPISGISSAKSNFIATLPGFILLVSALVMEKKMKPLLVGLIIFSLTCASWILIYLGKNVYIGDIRIYFIDFLILPILMTPAFYWLRYHPRNTIFY
jgi:hypothetical protein